MMKQKAGLSPNQKRLMLILLCLIPAVALYYGLPLVGFPWPHVLYVAVGGALAIGYTIYNRGFNTHGKTADMLSPDIPLSEREAMIASGKAREKRSAWVLYLLFPILITLLIDTVILFLLPDWSLFS